jgi:hypothetical protein
MENITIFVQPSNKIYVDDYLKTLESLDFDKGRLHIFCDVALVDAPQKAAIRAFFDGRRQHYRAVVIEDGDSIAAPRRSVEYARATGCDYFVIGENIILHPRALRWLHDLNLEVVAPMLLSDSFYSNFHAYVDDNGYYKDGDNYYKILSRNMKGIHDVPVVNGCYLIRHDCLSHVAYEDGSARLAYVVFSDRLRKNRIPQYIDNTRNYGIILNHLNKDRNQIAQADLLNNKTFFLNLGKQGGKKCVICDIGWLSTYVLYELYYLMTLLHDEYGFDIINIRSINFDAAGIIADLNGYDVILIGYHHNVKVPLDLISAYKIYKIDDLTSYDKNFNEIVDFTIKNVDLVISPYAYVFHEHHRHENVLWVPVSCALEGCKGHETITFNPNPIPKLLVSGNVRFEYPFREYVAGLDNEHIDRLQHPGYGQFSDSSEAFVRTKYYQKLNEYLCSFSDALIFRYVLVKNFEIAAAGALLLTDKAIEREMNQLGFVDGQTCIFCDRDSFLEKLAWIVDPGNREEVDRIRLAGMNLVKARHMTKHRAAQINDLAMRCVEGRATLTPGDGKAAGSAAGTSGDDRAPAFETRA